MTADTKQETIKWIENVGLSLEEGLALLLMLHEYGIDKGDEEIAYIQDLIASEEIEKLLRE